MKGTASATAGRSRRKTPAEETAQASLVPTLAPDAIARRAYELYERGGYEQGHDLDHWLMAERELQGS
jgi:hypothetical protein